MGRRYFLRTLREQRRLSQTQLQRLSGVAQNTISKLESRADARPEFATVVNLAKALGVRAEQLRLGPDPSTPPVEKRGRRPREPRAEAVP